MLSRFRQLELVAAAAVNTYLRPQHAKLDLDSSAALFMTDFLIVHPVVVSETMAVDEALRHMRNASIRMLLVRALEEPLFRGIVTASHINGGRVLAFMAANAMRNREEVEVRHIMTPREELHALRYEEVDRSCIGDVIATIKHLGEQHMLVVQRDNDHMLLRGIYSTTDIASSLQVSFEVEPHARTFFELEQAILHHVTV